MDITITDLDPADDESPDPDWRDRALCAETDPDAYFPEKGGWATSKLAKQVCRNCPVRAECLEYALEHDLRYGIYGGLSANERRALKRRQRAA